MRIINSIRNIYIGIITQIIIVILGFISRKVFIDSLGTEYLGINGLLTNVLSILSLVEGGIGTSIIYNLYKPLAENDKPTIIALVQLYKKLYTIIAFIILFLSLIMYPVLGELIKSNNSISHLSLVYMIFVVNNIISYLNAHKWSLINADQKGYVLSKYNLVFNIITTLSKIIILTVTGNYLLFLLIELLLYIVKNIWNGKVVNQRYPYIITKQKYEVSSKIKNNIIKNVKAIFLHNIGKQCVYGTDNILIGALINLKTVGLYSNYTMITGQVWSIINTVLYSIDSSVGNLITTESKEKSFEIFNVVYFFNFWIYSFCTIVLFVLMEPFIIWWLGENLILDRLTFIIILINFYISGMRSSIHIFKSKAGIFSEDKFIPLLEAGINLIGSIILAKYLNLAGILLATTISTVLLPLWIQSKLVYNKAFNKSVFEYFQKYTLYFALTIIVGLFTKYICDFMGDSDSFAMLFLKGILCTVFINTLYLAVFYRTKEMQYLLKVLMRMLPKKSIVKLQKSSY